MSFELEAWLMLQKLQICSTRVAPELPTQVLAQILCGFPPAEQKKFRTVCQYWNNTIEQLFDFEFHLNGDNWRSVVKSKARFISLIISNLNEKLSIEDEPTLTSFCSRIRKLEFNGITLASNFYLILQHSESLYELSLNQVRFELTTEPRKKSDDFQEWLPSLSVLKFQFFNEIQTTLKTKIDELDLLVLLAAIVENRALKKLYVTSFDNALNLQLHYLPFHVHDEYQASRAPASSYEAVKKIVQCNKSTLQTLSFLALDKHTEEVFQSLDLELDPRQINSEAGQLWMKGFNRCGSLFLEESATDACDGLPTPTRWINFLLERDPQQSQLRDLNLKFCNYPAAGFSSMQKIHSTLSSIILKNSETLVNISLTCTLTAKIRGSIWHFRGVLSRCHNLRSLTLKYIQDKDGEDWDALYEKPETPFLTFTGLEELPASLQHLSTNFALASRAAASLSHLAMDNIPNLDTLTLSKYNSREVPWFIFTDRSGIQLRKCKCSLATYNTLLSKLPKLKSLCLEVTKNRSIVVEDEWGEDDRNFSEYYQSISPWLIRNFKAGVQLNPNGLSLKIQTVNQ